MKGKLETWKGVVESKGLRINVNKTKIVIINLFFANALFLYLRKHQKTITFSDVFRG